MNTAFVIKNQHGLYLTKQQEWVSATEAHSLYRTTHRDEAINTVFEVSSRDIYLRAEVVVCELDTKGNPRIDAAAVEPESAPEQEPESELEPGAEQTSAPELSDIAEDSDSI
ncbi:MAG: hypothetical protein JWM78_1582 [Verrucomicrobiaceae bacterium]|nr:hypothetical protein [Verrucomicrobiaceae bacterium]